MEPGSAQDPARRRRRWPSHPIGPRFGAIPDAIARQPEAVYGDLAEVLRRADLRITNLECPLTQRDAPVWKSGSELKGAPEHLGGLTTIPLRPSPWPTIMCSTMGSRLSAKPPVAWTTTVFSGWGPE
jgi:hypothetical protein